MTSDLQQMLVTKQDIERYSVHCIITQPDSTTSSSERAVYMQQC